MLQTIEKLCQIIEILLSTVADEAKAKEMSKAFEEAIGQRMEKK